MNTYSIGSDSPRWWWPPAAAGVVAMAAVAAILVLPTVGSTQPDPISPGSPPVLTSDPWGATTPPAVGRQCFDLPVRSDIARDHDRPGCGRRSDVQRLRETGARRPGLDARP